MKQRYLDDILWEWKVAAFRNAIRLFRDACTLYGVRSYPTSFAVAVLAYEELGKAAHVQRVSETIDGNPGSEDHWYPWLKTSPVLRSHQKKQEYAYCDLFHWPLDSPVGKSIEDGEMEREKQKALYVEMVDEQVLTPARITQAKAYRQLELFIQALKVPGFDWAFLGLDCISNPRTEWLASEQLEAARKAFSTCVPPS